MAYLVAELAPDQPGGFCPRGGARGLWKSKHHEIMIEGPAETGKTYACLQKLDALCWKYPGSQAVIARKVQATLYTSVLQTYARVIGEGSPIRPYGGEKPEWFQYPNGSRIWIAGLDKPQKALSSERDFIYVNQAEELELDDWQTLLTRCTGRAGNAPYPQLFGDCNPGAPWHWIQHRPSLTLFKSRHEDNPTLFGDDGNITERGKRTLSILDSLTGVLHKRLRLGLWVQAEGVVYDGYNPDIHLIPRFKAPEDWPRYWVVDFGFVNAFVWQEWVQDGDGRLYRYRELYLTQTLVEDALGIILGVSVNEPRPRAIICDHDAEDRATFERHAVYCANCDAAITRSETKNHVGHRLTFFNLVTKAAYKAVSAGIQAVAARLKVQPDKRPRLFFVKDALIHEPDEELLASRAPHKAEQEIEMYVWDTSQGRRRGEEPVKKFDHGMDDVRYLTAFVDDIAEKKPPKTPAMDPLAVMRSVKRT